MTVLCSSWKLEEQMTSSFSWICDNQTASAFCSHSVCRKKMLTLKSSIFWSANSFYSFQISSLSAIFFEVSYLDHWMLSKRTPFFMWCTWMESCFLIFLSLQSPSQLAFLGKKNFNWKSEKHKKKKEKKKQQLKTIFLFISNIINLSFSIQTPFCYLENTVAVTHPRLFSSSAFWTHLRTHGLPSVYVGQSFSSGCRRRLQSFALCGKTYGWNRYLHSVTDLL